MEEPIVQAAIDSEKKTLWSRNYILLLLANLAVYFGFYLLSPVIQLQAQLVGGGSLEVSLVVGAFAVSSLIFRVLGGNISDIWGEKPIALVGLIMMFITIFALKFVPAAGLVLFRFLQGIGWGMASASLATAASHIVSKEYLGRGMGYFSLTAIIAISFSPIFSILLMNNYGFSAVVTVSVTLIAISGLIFLAVPRRRVSRSGKRPTVNLSNVIEKRALFPSLLEFLMILPASGMISMLAIYARVIDYQDIWIFYVGFSAMSMLTRPFIGKIYDTRGHREIVILGGLAMIGGFIILAFARTTIPLILSAVFYGLGYGALHPTFQAWAVSTVEPSRKGAASGTFLSSMDLGYAIGSYMLVHFAAGYGFTKMYLYSPVFIVVLLIVYVGYLVSRRKASAG